MSAAGAVDSWADSDDTQSDNEHMKKVGTITQSIYLFSSPKSHFVKASFFHHLPVLLHDLYTVC